MCRRWPPLDRSVTRIREPIATIYSRLPASVQAAIRRTRVRMHPGDLTAEDWARRPGADAERYWGAVDQPHRQILLEQMRSFDSPKRFLELGSHSGPNLRLLARTFPEARVSGVEINGDVVEQARSFLRVDGIASVQFTVGSIVDVLPRLPSNSEDLVFSCYALAYTPPGQIGGVLREAARVASLGLLFLEPHAREGHRSRFLRATVGWRHDYASTLRRLGIEGDAMRMVDTPGAPAPLNGCLVVDLRPTIDTPSGIATARP